MYMRASYISCEFCFQTLSKVIKSPSHSQFSNVQMTLQTNRWSSQQQVEHIIHTLAASSGNWVPRASMRRFRVVFAQCVHPRDQIQIYFDWDESSAPPIPSPIVMHTSLARHIQLQLLHEKCLYSINIYIERSPYQTPDSVNKTTRFRTTLSIIKKFFLKHL